MSDLELVETLQEKIRNRKRGAGLIGTVAPAKSVSNERAAAMTEGTAKDIASLGDICDGFIVYDVIDEPGRDGSARPFAFREPRDSSLYCAAIQSELKKLQSEESAPREFLALLYHVV